MKSTKLVVTGLSLISPLGDDPNLQMQKMYRGESAISQWKQIPTEKIFSKIGGDLGPRSAHSSLQQLYDLHIKHLPENHSLHKSFLKAIKLCLKLPWGTSHSIELALRAILDSKIDLEKTKPQELGVLVAGSNINTRYTASQITQFNEEPDFIDPLSMVFALDTDHAAVVSEVLGSRGACYTLGATCASGNLALMHAKNELLHLGHKQVLVVGPIFDLSVLELHALAIMQAISTEKFDHEPQKASRPFDIQRNGFIPSHAGAALLIEYEKDAIERGAKIYAEFLGASFSSDANHLPQPSQEGQVYAMNKLLDTCNINLEQIDYINAHATSTPQGDLVEIRSIKEVFKNHAQNIKINAPKSILGHPCWSASIVETATALLQMQDRCLHPSINIEKMDTEIDLNIIQSKLENFNMQYILKNSFGFGGLNCVSLFKKYEPGRIL